MGAALLLFVFLVVEVCWQLATAAALDHGTRRAARWATTGALAGNPNPSQEVARLIAGATGLPLRCERGLGVDVTHGASVAAATGPNAPTGAGGAGPGSVVVYTARCDTAALTPLGAALLRASPAGAVGHRTRFIVRNEPYAPN